ncbi:hypothetical protein DL98DRAFT_186624 [Cadophora sp. DSE1049]|nr:hypothetical protein DL98DRAFT_186624 [Cadophora sp. DSE1049]
MNKSLSWARAWGQLSPYSLSTVGNFSWTSELVNLVMATDTPVRSLHECPKLKIYDVRQIRLLQLYSSDEFEAEVSCDISLVNFTAAQSYEALSYCWSDTGAIRRILLQSP